MLEVRMDFGMLRELGVAFGICFGLFLFKPADHLNRFQRIVARVGIACFFIVVFWVILGGGEWIILKLTEIQERLFS